MGVVSVLNRKRRLWLAGASFVTSLGLLATPASASPGRALPPLPETCTERGSLMYPGEYEGTLYGQWYGRVGADVIEDAVASAQVKGTVGVPYEDGPNGLVQTIDLTGTLTMSATYGRNDSAAEFVQSYTFTPGPARVMMTLASDRGNGTRAHGSIQLQYGWTTQNPNYRDGSQTLALNAMNPVSVACDGLQMLVQGTSKPEPLTAFPLDVRWEEGEDAYFGYRFQPGLVLKQSPATQQAMQDAPKQGRDRIERILAAGIDTPADRKRAARQLLAFADELHGRADCVSIELRQAIHAAYARLLKPIEAKTRALAADVASFEGGRSPEPGARAESLSAEWIDQAIQLSRYTGCQLDSENMGRAVQDVAKTYLRLGNRARAVRLDRIAVLTFAVESILPLVAQQMQAEAEAALKYLQENYTTLTGDALEQAVKDAVLKDGWARIAGASGTGAEQWAQDHGLLGGSASASETVAPPAESAFP